MATTCLTCESAQALLAELQTELRTRHSGGFAAKYGADGTYMLRDVVDRLRQALAPTSGRHRPDCPHSAGFESMLCVCWTAGLEPDIGSNQA